MSKQNLLTMYLGVYNIVCCCGWLQILALCLYHITSNTPCLLWGDTCLMLKSIQTVAVLEILHCQFHLTRSPMATTALQVGSRIFYVWVVFVPHSALLSSSPTPSGSPVCLFSIGVLTSWALVEVIRYSFYAASTLLGAPRVPYFLVWLRYSAFLVLYVTGISSELGVIACVLLSAWQRGAELTAVQGLVTASVLLFTLLYIPGAPTMYGHMLKARKKQLGGGGGGGKVVRSQDKVA